MKTGIATTLAVTLLAGAATVGAQPQGRKDRPQQCRKACHRQQQQCGNARKGGRKQANSKCHRQQQARTGNQRQAFQGYAGKSRFAQLTPRQRKMVMMRKHRKMMQAQAQRGQFQKQPQMWQQFPKQPRPQQFQGHPQRPQPQQFQGKPQQRPFPGGPEQLPPNLTPEQRQHIQKMQQRFRQEVRRYLSGQEKKEHAKPKGNHPPKKGKPHKHPKAPDKK